MKPFIAAGLALLSSLLSAQTLASAPDKILFGSCSHQAKPMPILQAINKEQADVFLFLGDNIYGDTQNMQLLKQKYQQLGAQPGFSQLTDSHEVMAIWDDHDFGQNDAGAEYPQKEASRQIMLDFFNTPADSARRQRPDGIYTSRHFGEGDKRIAVIMPDLRWNRPAINTVSQQVYEQQRKPVVHKPAD